MQSEQASSPEAGTSAEGVTIWSTKGIGFWALLSAMLIKAKPESILELGGGRSTTFLADYAYRYGKTSITIEQSELWYQKIRNDLKFMHIEGEYVFHLPLVWNKMSVAPIMHKIAGGNPEKHQWYDFDAFKRIVGDRAFDMLFLDGPVGQSRMNKQGQALVTHAAREARMIIVDDVQREHNLDYFQMLADKFGRDNRFFYRYDNGGILVVAVADLWRDTVRSCFECLELDYTKEL